MAYFEGVRSERALAWRIQDSLCLRAWLDFGPTQLINQEFHKEIDAINKVCKNLIK